MIHYSAISKTITVHYQSAVSMISFAQVWTVQWSDTIPSRIVQFTIGIHLTLFHFNTAYIWRFRPAILFSTEHYEFFNHIFCLLCIHSNCSAPSQDMCNSFAAQDTMKHVATGGFWLDSHSKKWVQAGSAVLAYVASHPHVTGFLGLNIEKLKPPGIWLVLWKLLYWSSCI